MKPGAIFVVDVGGGCFGHPDGYAEPLATRRHQVVGWRWTTAALTDPEDLARQWMEGVIDPRVLGIRILLMVCTIPEQKQRVTVSIAGGPDPASSSENRSGIGPLRTRWGSWRLWGPQR